MFLRSLQVPAAAVASVAGSVCVIYFGMFIKILIFVLILIFINIVIKIFILQYIKWQPEVTINFFKYFFLTFIWVFQNLISVSRLSGSDFCFQCMHVCM